ncbi:MAG: amino acid ABC transporter permease, partial [Sutterellaceae bacterium]|nr:amino acid ABC transporter permease [Burkholderiaceae bacterium]MDW8430375.1 amino acid ABC transporter permease [Sutterellaceae bacterium]
MGAVFEPIPPRPAPVKTEGLLPWIRANLFGDVKSALATLILVALAAYYLPAFFGWAVAKAVLATDANACQAARGSGACWGVVIEKFRLIVFGRYPFEQ